MNADTIERLENLKRTGSKADSAWAAGALDALAEKPADGERYGAHFADYLSGWCAANGI